MKSYKNENRLNKKGDIIIYVDAKQNLINKRLRERSNYNKKLLKKIFFSI